MKNINSLILSGGGSAGAFQAGVLYELFKTNHSFQRIYGTSTGALNALLVGQSYIEKNPSIYKKVWTEIVKSNSDIYKKNLFRYILNSPPYNFKPLRKLMDNHINFKKILELKEKITLYSVDLVTGKAVAFSNHDEGMTPEKFKEAAIASATFPPMFSPVKLENYQLVDGGIRENVPVQDIISNWSSDSILIILCASQKILPIYDEDYDRITEIAKRTIQIMTNEITVTDLKMIIAINQLLESIEEEQKDEWLSDKQIVDLNLIMPDEKLKGKVLDFDPIFMKYNFAKGQDEAFDFIRNPDESIEKSGIKYF